MALTAPILGGSKKAAASLQETVFAVEAHEGLLHEVVKAEMAAMRQGTHATKTRGMVAGGRAKPFRQKGTGRARQGTTRAAQFTGGGVVFGPQPRSYAMKVNRKAYAKARRIALSLHAASGSLAVFDASSFEEPRTKDAIALIAAWRTDRPLLVVVNEYEDEAGMSFRNLPRTVVTTVDETQVRDLLWARSLLVSSKALEQLHWILGDRVSDAVGIAAADSADEEVEA